MANWTWGMEPVNAPSPGLRERMTVQVLGEQYCYILTDPTFEDRLKRFDPNLKLMFNQATKRWTILENAPDGSGWNIIITAQDDVTKEPKPLGEWIFNRLFVYRERYEARSRDPDKFFLDLLAEEDRQRAEIEAKHLEMHRDILKDEHLQFRKAFREMNNSPTERVYYGPSIQPNARKV